LLPNSTLLPNEAVKIVHEMRSVLEKKLASGGLDSLKQLGLKAMVIVVSIIINKITPTLLKTILTLFSIYKNLRKNGTPITF